jgi:hypothetical protein
MIQDKEAVTFRKTFNLAKKFAVQLIGMSVLLQITLLILTIVISAPISYLLSAGSVSKAVILLGLGALVFVPFAFFLFAIGVLAPMFIVMFNLPLRLAILASTSIVGLVWRKVLGLSLLLGGLSIVTAIVAGIISSPFVIFAILSYHKGGSAWTLGLPILISSIVFISIQSLFISFQQTAWVLFFSEVVRPQKFEEEATAEVAPTV